MLAKELKFHYLSIHPFFLPLSSFQGDDIFCTALTDLWVSQTWDPNVNKRDACETHMSMREMLYKLSASENFSSINFCGLGWKHPRTHFSSSFYSVKTWYSFINLSFVHFFNQTKPNQTDINIFLAFESKKHNFKR